MPETSETLGKPRGDTVARAADAIRSLILSRELFPGQQLRQDHLSASIGISRGPTREALQALSNEGLVTHSINRGYTVTRFDFAEMQQLYKLRELAETEVLHAVAVPTKRQLARLRSLNEQIRDPETSVEEAMRLNQDFHFQIFELSSMSLIVKEIDRWWRMSMAYRALSIGIWAERAAMMGDAHDLQIEALLERDLDRLVHLSNEHREVTLRRIEAMLRS